MYEAIGIGYLTLSALVFTAEWIIAGIAGLVWLQRIATRGKEEEGRDLQLSIATREDITKAEVTAGLMRRNG